MKRREFVTLLGGSAIALTFSPAASAHRPSLVMTLPGRAETGLAPISG